MPGDDIQGGIFDVSWICEGGLFCSCLAIYVCGFSVFSGVVSDEGNLI